MLQNFLIINFRRKYKRFLMSNSIVTLYYMTEKLETVANNYINK